VALGSTLGPGSATNSTASALIILNGVTGGATFSGTLTVNNAGGPGDVFLGQSGATTVFEVKQSGDVLAQRFVAISNTAYYLDPANTAVSLNTAGGITIGANSGVSITTTGDISVNGGTGKVTAGTFDPAYTINGNKYATFLPSMTGVKEETTGVVNTSELIPGVGYRSIIDFSNPSIGSDIWLFSKATDLKNNINSLVVLLDPSGNVRVWYDLDIANFKLSIFSSAPSRVSYRLTAPRFDTATWGNTRTGGVTGFNLDPLITPIPPSGPISTPSADGLAGYSIVPTASISGVLYALKDSIGQFIFNVGTYSQAAIANLKTGLFQVDTITPLASTSAGITLKLGNNQQFAITNNVGTPSATFDSIGNATIAGTLTTNNLLVNQNTTFDGDVSQSDGINGTPDQQSMVANAGFELNSVNSAMPDAWSCTNTGTSTGSCLRDTTTIIQGSAALQVNKTNASNTLQFQSTCFPVTAGGTYNVNDMDRASVNLTLGSGRFQIGLWDFTSRANCQTFTGATAHLTAVQASTTYTVRSTTQTIDSTGTWARAGGIVNGFAATAFVDSFRVTPSTLTSSIDIAENYYASGSIPAGSVVQISSLSDSAVEKATASAGLMGIVSTKPAITLGEGIANQTQLSPIALSGRVPAIVSTENGPIAQADAITSSAIPGVGAKAANAGMTVGKALEAFTPTDAACPSVSNVNDISWPEDDGTNPAKPCYAIPNPNDPTGQSHIFVGKIMTFVNVTWFAPVVTAETHTGTLFADRIISKFGSIDNLNTTTASATYITNITNIHYDTATPSAQTPSEASPSATTLSDLNPSTITAALSEASMSALFALGATVDPDMPHVLITKDITLTSSLAILGDSMLGKTSIAGGLDVDSAIHLGSSGIESFGNTLYLQKGRLADLDFMNGAIVVNTLGNVLVTGNLTVSGVLGVSSITPIPGSDLTFNLGQGASPSASASPSGQPSGFGKILVKGAGNIPVAAFDAGGNATFSGTLNASRLMISDASPLGATQSGALTGNATIGAATLPANSTLVVVSSTNITDNSFIYITPTTPTGDHVLYIVDKVPGVGFTVGVKTASGQPITFNWWVVN
jgi:hypothetical protein